MGDYPNWLTDGVGELLVGGVDGLAESLVSPASVVADDANSFGDVILEGFVVRLSCSMSTFGFSMGSFGCGAALTIVPSIDGRKQLFLLLHQVRQLVH